MARFEDYFCNLYPVVKTLRNRLEPVEGTQMDKINESFKIDDERSVSYFRVKELFDDTHKEFIDKCLSSLQLPVEDGKSSLKAFAEQYNSKMPAENAKSKKAILEDIKKELRKCVSKSFGKKDDIQKTKSLFDSTFQRISNDDKKILANFKGFSGYFSNYQEVRKNLYKNDGKSSSVAYRLIDENLPKFCDNINVYRKLQQVPSLKEQLQQSFSQFTDILPEGVKCLDQLFEIGYFNHVLTQLGIDTYNTVIGKRITEDGEEQKGLNECINLYNQQERAEGEGKLPLFRPLYKQILSDRKRLSWLPETFDSDESVLSSLGDFCSTMLPVVYGDCNSLEALLQTLDESSQWKVYIENSSELTHLSNTLLGDWAAIHNAIGNDYDKKYPVKKALKKSAEDREKYVKKTDSFSIGYLDECLSLSGTVPQGRILNYFRSFGRKDENDKSLSELLAEAVKAATPLLTKNGPLDNKLSESEQSVEEIKNLLDALLNAFHFARSLSGSGLETDKDDVFYSRLSEIIEELEPVVALYNKVRNYLTKRPFSEDIIKLHFNCNGNFLNGWTDSHTENSDAGTQYGGYLFRKRNEIGEYDYFVGFSRDTKLFRRKEGASGQFERFDYYQIKAKSVYNISYAVANTKAEGCDCNFTNDKATLCGTIWYFVENCATGDEQSEILSKFDKQKDLTPKTMVKILQAYPSLFQHLLADEAFQRINELVCERLKRTMCSLTRIPDHEQFRDLNFKLFSEAQTKLEEICKPDIVSYFPVPDGDIEKAIKRDKNPLFLFKITNKDLSFATTSIKQQRKSRGRDNLHTMYFREVLNDRQKVFSIGSGAVYLRRATEGLKKEPTHPKNEPVANKNPLAKKKESVFPYDLIKDRRYTKDNMQFHLSFTTNYIAEKRSANDEALRFIKDGGIRHVIGIDRGERHLLYVSVIDLKGNIIEQFSLNTITNTVHETPTDYNRLLSDKSAERDKARKNWQKIENIRNLKEGYMSQVVHKIAQLVLKYDAIVVLENLNQGFKRGRQKVEKQVYQNFEKMLITKFNYLVDKSRDKNEPGGLMRGLQLTDQFESFAKLSSQCGILFYISAWNTSKIDPVTGFVNLFDLRLTSMAAVQEFFSKFQSIHYNKENDWFEFVFDYSQFTNRAEDSRTQWTLCSYGPRIVTKFDRSKGGIISEAEIDLTASFKQLLTNRQIALEGDLKQAIAGCGDRSFFFAPDGDSYGFFDLFRLLLQMRNSKANSEVDYIISPALNDDGECFDSRRQLPSLPDNADANGAYNIARKGLWQLRTIQEKGEMGSLKNNDWLKFAQDKPYLLD